MACTLLVKYCGKGWGGIRQLKRHMVTLTVEKPFTCTVFDKSYRPIQMSSLKLHIYFLIHLLIVMQKWNIKCCCVLMFDVNTDHHLV